uniref:Uncharacterized protein n=1 Tax=Sphaerodactylus townsendi TaxID=933632 RepID=A0ACB8F3I4_9SAUR
MNMIELLVSLINLFEENRKGLAEVVNTLSLIMALDQGASGNPLVGDGAPPTLLDYMAELVRDPPNVEIVATGVEQLCLSKIQDQAGGKDSHGSELGSTATTELLPVDQWRTGGIQIHRLTLGTQLEDSYNPD